MRTSSHCSQLGTSLLEAVVAAGILATVLTGVLPLVTTAVVGTGSARAEFLAAHLARQRLEQLQTLSYVRTSAGLLADEHSALDQAEAFSPGGSGLIASGLAPLEASTSRWIDWVDEHGAWQADDVSPPPGAKFRRRWGILAAGGDGCLRIWVEVLPLAATAGHRIVHDGSVQCPWGVVTP